MASFGLLQRALIFLTLFPMFIITIEVLARYNYLKRPPMGVFLWV